MHRRSSNTHSSPTSSTPPQCTSSCFPNFLLDVPPKFQPSIEICPLFAFIVSISRWLATASNFCALPCQPGLENGPPRGGNLMYPTVAGDMPPPKFPNDAPPISTEHPPPFSLLHFHSPHSHHRPQYNSLGMAVFSFFFGFCSASTLVFGFLSHSFLPK